MRYKYPIPFDVGDRVAGTGVGFGGGAHIPDHYVGTVVEIREPQYDGDEIFIIWDNVGHRLPVSYNACYDPSVRFRVVERKNKTDWNEIMELE